MLWALWAYALAQPSQIPMFQHFGPTGRSQVLLERASELLRRSQVLLERASELLKRSQVLLECASELLKRSQVLIERASA